MSSDPIGVDTNTSRGGDDPEGVAGNSADSVGHDGDLTAEILDVARQIADAEARVLDVASAKVQRKRPQLIVEGRDEHDQALLDFFGRT